MVTAACAGGTSGNPAHLGAQVVGRDHPVGALIERRVLVLAEEQVAARSDVPDGARGLLAALCGHVEGLVGAHLVARPQIASHLELSHQADSWVEGLQHRWIARWIVLRREGGHRLHRLLLVPRQCVDQPGAREGVGERCILEPRVHLLARRRQVRRVRDDHGRTRRSRTGEPTSEPSPLAELEWVAWKCWRESSREVYRMPSGGAGPSRWARPNELSTPTVFERRSRLALTTRPAVTSMLWRARTIEAHASRPTFEHRWAEGSRLEARVCVELSHAVIALAPTRRPGSDNCGIAEAIPPVFGSCPALQCAQPGRIARLTR